MELIHGESLRDALFQAAGALDFDVARDGRFLVQIEERSADPTVHLLINWPARLPALNSPL